MGTYVVCRTHSCRQTYPMSFFGEATKDTKNVACPKCGGVLIDDKGHATFSSHDWVIPVVDPIELEKQEQQELAEKKEQMKQLQDEIEELEGSCNG